MILYATDIVEQHDLRFRYVVCKTGGRCMVSQQDMDGDAPWNETPMMSFPAAEDAIQFAQDTLAMTSP